MDLADIGMGAYGAISTIPVVLLAARKTLFMQDSVLSRREVPPQNIDTLIPTQWVGRSNLSGRTIPLPKIPSN